MEYHVLTFLTLIMLLLCSLKKYMNINFRFVSETVPVKLLSSGVAQNNI